LLTGDTAANDLTIRDQRLPDPVCADVSDNHSNGGKSSSPLVILRACA
jgi:hypothetical protein